jgi:hypothetical protein
MPNGITRCLKKYNSGDLFKVDLQTNLKTYIDTSVWLKIKPKHPLPWDYSDMLLTCRKYVEQSNSSRLSS